MEKNTLLNIRKNAANTPLHERHQQIDLAKKKSESIEIEEELRKTYIKLIDDKLFSAASDDSLMDKPIEAIVKLTGTNGLDKIIVENLREYYETNKMNFSYDKKEQAIRVSIAEAPENETCLGSLLLATKIRTDFNLSYDLFIKTMNELRTGLIISAVSDETAAITAHKTIVLRKIRSFIDTFITAVKENFESGGVDVKIETKDLRNGDTMITITATVTE